MKTLTHDEIAEGYNEIKEMGKMGKGTLSKKEKKEIKRIAYAICGLAKKIADRE